MSGYVGLMVFFSFMAGALSVLTLSMWTQMIFDWRPFAYATAAAVMGLVVTVMRLT